LQSKLFPDEPNKTKRIPCIYIEMEQVDTLKKIFRDAKSKQTDLQAMIELNN